MKKLTGGYEIRHETLTTDDMLRCTLPFSHGFTEKIYLNNECVGLTEYYEESENRIRITLLEIKQELRRKGIGTGFISALKKEYGMIIAPILPSAESFWRKQGATIKKTGNITAPTAVIET